MKKKCEHKKVEALWIKSAKNNQVRWWCRECGSLSNTFHYSGGFGEPVKWEYPKVSK